MRVAEGFSPWIGAAVQNAARCMPAPPRGALPALIARGALALLAAAAISGCAAVARYSPASGKAFLWEVSPPPAATLRPQSFPLSPPPNAAGRLYLLGSVHVARADDLVLDPAVLAAYERSQGLVVEVDTREMAKREAQRDLAALVLLPEGQRLADHLPADTYERLVFAFAERGVPEDTVAGMKAWAAALLLTQVELTALGFSPEHGVDAYFLRRAGDKRVVALETPQSQLALMDALPDHVQIALVEANLEDLPQLQPLWHDIAAAWRGGDAPALEALLFRPLTEYTSLAVFYDRLFFDRNRTMTATIERLAAEGGTWFVVVGAGHLVGKRGIVAMLADRGYSVRQLPATE
jgi:hypothetical protein